MQKILILASFLLACATLQAQDNTPEAASAQIQQECERLKNEYLQGQEKNKDKINAAIAAAEAVEKAGAYIESIAALFENGELTLPVGIKKGDYTLIIQKIQYDEKTGKSKIYATCSFKFKESGQLIAFEGEAVVEGRNGLGTEGSLGLIAPVFREMGKEALIVIEEGTKVKFGCEGVESFDAKIAFIVTSKTIIPVDTQGLPMNKPIKFSIEGIFSDFDRYVASLNINQSFSINGLKDVFFTLKGATLDQSDTETSTMTKFPPQYFSSESESEKKLWKGLSITEASLSLPAIFKKPGSNDERLTVSLQQVLFDENGFTGNVSVKDLISRETIDPEKWDLSLNDFSLGILKNNITSFGFSGDINIPPFGENALHAYTATINPVNKEYELTVDLAGTYPLPVLKSKIALNKLSTISLRIKDSDVYPSINASGTLTINAPVGSSDKNTTDSSKNFSIPDIVFENLLISREEPYLSIGAIGLTGKAKTPSIAGFELSVEELHSFNDSKGGGLLFAAGVSLSETFAGSTSMKLYGDYKNWKFKEVSVERIKVKFESKAYSLMGDVWFKNGDAVYGNGFRGSVKLSLLEKFNLDAVAVFGKVDNYRYFLADVYLELPPASGLPVPPVLAFYGFGGGLYTKMQQATKMPQLSAQLDPEFGKSLSGITYVPDNKVGLGFMATTKFGLSASPDAMSAKVGLEMQFNNHGGLNFVQLRGDVVVMTPPDMFGGLMDNVIANMEKIEASGNKQPVKAKKSDLEKSEPESKKSSFLSASINIEYDAIHSVFAADLNAYLNVAGLIKGIGPNDRLGWASAYFAPDKWYTYMGTPSDRFGISVLKLATLSGYFMLGNDIPGLPLPPERVLQNLSQDRQDQLLRTSSDKLTFGQGIAFGMAFDLDFNAKLFPFYAHFALGMGSEFMLVNVGGNTCSNFPGKPGIDGWFASAQAWAYVEAGIGIEVSLFGSTKRFNIFDMSVGALLQGSGPNPLYFMGAVGGKFSVLGGLVSGNCNFDFEIGEKCIFTGGSPFGEDVISELTPVTGAKEVSVFVAPQVLFNIPVEVEMVIDEADVKGTYKASLEEFSAKYKDTGKQITGKLKFNDDGTICMIDPEEPFESQKEVELYAKVGFQKKINNQWVAVLSDDGNALFEERKEDFHTGDRPKEIQPEHVKYSYPIDRQYNFYVNEYKTGYIMTTQNYNYLFTDEKPEGFNQILRISDISGKTHEKQFIYHVRNGDNGIKFEIGFSLEGMAVETNQIYKLAIVNVPKQANADMNSNVKTVTTSVAGANDVAVSKQQATGDLLQLDEKEIYALNFRSSSYKTFAEKIDDIPIDEAVPWQEYPYVYKLISNIYDYAAPVEMFDVNEVNPDPEQRLVVIEPLYEHTDWYTQKIKSFVYNQQVLNDAGLSDLKLTKEDVTYYVMRTSAQELNEDMINANTRLVVSPWGSMHYNAPYYADRDYCQVKNSLARKVVANPNAKVSEAARAYLASTYVPEVGSGKYPIKISYMLPGPGERTATSVAEKTISLTKF